LSVEDAASTATRRAGAAATLDIGAGCGESAQTLAERRPRALGASANSLYEKWSRDSTLPLSARFRKSRNILWDRGRAKVYLRHADLGVGVRSIGKPHVVVDRGTLILGDDCVIRSIVARTELYVGPGATMVLGRKVHVNSGCSFSAVARVEIGDRVEIAPHVTIQDNAFHDLYDRARLPESKPVVVEDDVWLAANCTLLPGVRVGRGAVVGAHAVVTRDVEPFSVVAGVPAQPVAHLDPERFVVSAEY
jgi:acetyltransferase-like isoleucine patch superfamily enzyme